MHFEPLFPEEIADHHIVDRMVAGHPDYEPLAEFIRNDAKESHKSHISRTFVICPDVPDGHEDKHRVVGYISFTNSEISFRGANKPKALEHIRYTALPAFKITRLMVCDTFRGQRLGELLISFSIQIAEERIAPWVGCRLLMVDSKRGAMGFYEKCGFKVLDSDKNRRKPTPVMHLDLRDVDYLGQDAMVTTDIEHYSIPDMAETTDTQ